jgi:hypothetical protein
VGLSGSSSGNGLSLVELPKTMINAERIILALDRHLDHDVDLIVYGRAALALGFSSAPDSVSRSLDVDAIIPTTRVDNFRNDHNFWDAQEAANRELEKDGLYITHLFEADQIFLRSDWEKELIPISRPATRWLHLLRPATLDLILTKMMRGNDAQDMEDIAFLVQADQILPAQLEGALNTAVIPDIDELRQAFEQAKPKVRELVRAAKF